MVGDPFHSSPEPPWDQNRELKTPGGLYRPMKAAVILIEFASSELWQSHLCPSNFISCKDVVSTDKGRRSALSAIEGTALMELPEFLCMPPNIVPPLDASKNLDV